MNRHNIAAWLFYAGLTLMLIAAVTGCTEPPRTMPAVRLAMLDGSPLPDGALDGARAWQRLGFQIDTTAPLAEPECAIDWFARPEEQCKILIKVDRVPFLQSSQTLIDERLIQLDARISDYAKIRQVMAHETGHAILRTPRHTDWGVMSGGGWTVLEDPDYELACETIEVCQ